MFSLKKNTFDQWDKCIPLFVKQKSIFIQNVRKEFFCFYNIFIVSLQVALLSLVFCLPWFGGNYCYQVSIFYNNFHLHLPKRGVREFIVLELDTCFKVGPRYPLGLLGANVPRIINPQIKKRPLFLSLVVWTHSNVIPINTQNRMSLPPLASFSVTTIV